jgi:hypothetical protein
MEWKSEIQNGHKQPQFRSFDFILNLNLFRASDFEFRISPLLGVSHVGRHDRHLHLRRDHRRDDPAVQWLGGLWRDPGDCQRDRRVDLLIVFTSVFRCDAGRTGHRAGSLPAGSLSRQQPTRRDVLPAVRLQPFGKHRRCADGAAATAPAGLCDARTCTGR